MQQLLDTIDIEVIKNIALEAGEAIMKIYLQEFDVEYKTDNSPLTQADLEANKIICDALEKYYPNIPIISEENKEVAYSTRKEWEYFWCIDPLDGTKEFVKKNGEFSVNIALIYKDTPVLGVVYAPVTKELYYAKKAQGAFKNGKKLPLKREDSNYIVVASSSHLSQKNKDFFDTLVTTKKKVILQKGSSLKLCMVAANEADIYPRLSPTMEWDSAAADAIVREAGAMSYNLETKKPLVYNKQNLQNPFFLVTRDRI